MGVVMLAVAPALAVVLGVLAATSPPLALSTRFFRPGEVPGSIPGQAGVVHSESVRVLYERGLIGLARFGSVLVASMLYLESRGKKAEGLERALLSGAYVVVVYVACITDNALDYYGVLGQHVTVLAPMSMATIHAGRRPLPHWRRGASAEADRGARPSVAADDPARRLL